MWWGHAAPSVTVPPENVTDGLLYHQTFTAYAAVYSVAHALHKAAALQLLRLPCTGASAAPGR